MRVPEALPEISSANCCAWALCLPCCKHCLRAPQPPVPVKRKHVLQATNHTACYPSDTFSRALAGCPCCYCPSGYQLSTLQFILCLTSGNMFCKGHRPQLTAQQTQRSHSTVHNSLPNTQLYKTVCQTLKCTQQSAKHSTVHNTLPNTQLCTTVCQTDQTAPASGT
jgi:hypothetical protein